MGLAEVKRGRRVFRSFRRGLLALAWLASPAVAQNAPSVDAAHSLGEILFLRSGSTGLVLVVVREDQTSIEGFGQTAPGSHQVPAADSVVRLCSLTKIFTTDLLVRLVQAGSVRLDTPLQALAPDNRHVPIGRNGRQVTLGDLATHTAGLPREAAAYVPGVPHFTYPSFERRWSWLPGQRLLSTPGTAALYSNIGFDLLGDALAQAAHVPYPQLLASRITQPLGMVETTFTPTPAQCARLLMGAHPEGPCTDTTNTAGSSGLYSTAEDMARFLHYLLDTGGVASSTLPRQDAAAQAAYLNPASLTSVRGLDHAGEPTGIGLGWIHTAGSENTDIIQKTGGGAGYLTYIAMLPARHVGLFVAATEGAVETHVNVFRDANNVLLAIAGLPMLNVAPLRPGRPATRTRSGANAHRAGSKPLRTTPKRS